MPLDKLDEVRRRVVEGYPAIHIAVSPENDSTPGGAQPCRILDQAIQHWLQVERRAAHDLQHLGSRRLLIEGNREVTVPHLQFLEQAHILDGYDRLVGEGLQERDLFIREAPRFAPRDADCAERHPLPHHGHPYPTPMPP